jgi:hypothetical protein
MMKRFPYVLVGSVGAAVLFASGCGGNSSKHVNVTFEAGAAGEDNGGDSSQTSGGSSNGGAAGVTPLGGAGADAGSAGQGTEAGSGGAAGGQPSEVAAGGTAGEAAVCSQIAPDARLTSHLKITADNECEVFVNGTSVGMTANWSSAVTIDVSLFLHPGRKNVVAIVGTNTSSQGGNDRGIVGELTIDSSGGTTPLLVTDHAWRVSQTVDTAWASLAFDDSSWIAATEVAAVGDAPWGNVLPSSTAKWIWFAPIPPDTANKPNQETTYARRDFYLAPDGATIANTPACRPPSGS